MASFPSPCAQGWMGVCTAAMGSTQGKIFPAPKAMGRKSSASKGKTDVRLSSSRRTTMYHREPAASLAMRKTMAARAIPDQ